MNIKVWHLFFANTFLYLLIVFGVNQFIITDVILEDKLQELYPAYMIDDVMALKNRFWWVAYALEPVMLLLKLLLLFLPVSVAALLSDIDVKATDILFAGLAAESIFIVQRIWYSIITWNNLDLLYDNRLVDLYPLSLIGIFGSANMVDWLIYPIQLLNVFEILYVVAVTTILMKRWEISWPDTFNIVLPAYLAGLTIWVGFVIFITIQLT